jgi:hypothetical protein
MVIPKKFIKYINCGDKPGAFPLNPFAKTSPDYPYLPPGRQGLQNLFSRIQNSSGPIKTAEFQIYCTQVRPRGPQGNRKSERPRPEIGNGIPVGKFEGQSRQEPGKTKHVPGQKVPEVS